MPDRTMTCLCCGQNFLFLEREQEFFRKVGLKNDPKRCLPCRKKRKAQSATQPPPARAYGEDAE